MTIDISAAIGRDDVPGTLVLDSPDSGEYAGYPFVESVAYFVPVRDGGSAICDPITEVDDPAALTWNLAVRANEAGIAFAMPSDVGPGDPSDDSGATTGSGGSSDTNWVPVLAIAVATAVALAVGICLQRRAGVRS